MASLLKSTSPLSASNSSTSPNSGSGLSALSESASLQSATASVWSNLGLSAFDRPLNRDNIAKVKSHLKDLTFEIVAVWVVSRPLNGRPGTKLEHWCVKIQAPPALVSIDFLEHGKKGAFGLQMTAASKAELADFLKYKVTDDKNNIIGKPKQWNHIASVTPSPISSLENTVYFEVMDRKKQESFLSEQKGKSKSKQMDRINIDKKACDVADFLEMWTKSVDQRNEAVQSKKLKKERVYNPITGNCQQFAAELFEYLVGDKYPDKVQNVKQMAQSPWDQKQWGGTDGADLDSSKDVDDDSKETEPVSKLQENNADNNTQTKR